jgi:hypothetical protein
VSELRVVVPPKSDPRVKHTYALAKELAKAFNKSRQDRDILISATGVMLAQMFVSGGADETFVRFVVSQQLTEIVVRNMPVLRKAMENA